MTGSTRPVAPPLHVAAAAVFDDSGRVLIARRLPHQHQGNLWEFPGGKVEADETVEHALVRELEEEIGITPTRFRPLIRVPHDYGDRRVLLDVWRVDAFDGVAHGRDQQPIEWTLPENLSDYQMPAANLPIARAVQLPSCYLITPEPGGRCDWPIFLIQLTQSLQRGSRLVQLRAKTAHGDEMVDLVRQVCDLCHRFGARVLLNSGCDVDPWQCNADGVHLTAADLQGIECLVRPNSRFWVAASCHNANEIERALAVGVDFVVVGPVKQTASHPGRSPIGWDHFRALTERSPIPVYALGGMEKGDLTTAWQYGGQGIAAIRALWCGGTQLACND